MLQKNTQSTHSNVNTCYRSSKRVGAYTIIELMLAISLLAIVASLAAPSFNDFITKQRLRTNLQNVSSLFNNARNLAVSELRDVWVCWNDTSLDITRSSVVISPDEMAVIKETGNVNERLVSKIVYQNDVVIYKDNQADNCVEYSSDGRTDTAVTFAICRSASDASDSRGMSISAQGRMLIEDNDTGGVQSCL